MKTLIITTTIALIMLSSFPISAMTNSTERNEIFKSNASEIYLLLEEVNENPLTVEEWMKTPEYFNNCLFTEYEEQEINVEPWMYDTDYFYSLYNDSANENYIFIESWMTDPEYFYHPVPEINQEKAVLIEDWMLDINYFSVISYSEKNYPARKIIGV